MPEIIRAESLWKSAADEDKRGRAWKGKGKMCIRDRVLNDDYSWNTLYVYFEYRFFDTQEVPFIDTMEVSVKSPHTLHVEV